MNLTLYGIPACDSCRKARKALEAAGHEVAFRDLRAELLDAGKLGELYAQFGEALVNRQSTTWRGLSEGERAQGAERLLAGHPTLIKRPVIEGEGQAPSLGWTPAVQARWLG